MKTRVFVHSNSGFSLVEFSVAIGLFSLLVYGMAGAVAAYTKDMGQVRLTSTRMEVVAKIRAASRDLVALQNSGTLEAELDRCLNFSLVGPECQSKDGAGNTIRVPFTLVTNSGVADIVAGPAIAVPAAPHQPVYYDRDARRCTDPAAPAPICPIQAVVEYSSVCQGGENTCLGADSIMISYRVQMRTGYTEPNAPPLKVATGTVFVNVRGGKYVQIPDAFAMGSGISLNEIDMAKGHTLAIQSLEQIKANVLVRDSEPVDQLEVRVWTLPDGCDFSNIGSGICVRPALADYELRANVVVDPNLLGPSVGRYTAEFNVAFTGYAEVIILSKVAGTYLRRSNTVMRLKSPSVPIVSVTGPTAVVKDCNDPLPAKFTFQAQDGTGLVAYSATVSPPLPNGSTTLPGLAFNLANSNPQVYSTAYETFAPGVNYTITFTVQNNDGVTSTATHTFYVQPLPEPLEFITFESPAAGGFFRSVDNLAVSAVVNLECGKSLNQTTFSTAKGASQWMPPTNASCAPFNSGIGGVVSFRCTGTYGCRQWLNIADCSSFDDAGLATLTAVATPSSGTNVTKSTDFTVSTHISVSFPEKDTKFIIVNNHFASATLPITVVFSTLPPEPANLKLVYSNGATVSFQCAAGALICAVPSAPAPASAVTINLEVEPSSQTVYRAVVPKVSQVSIVNRFDSCATQEHPLTCTAGTTLKSEITNISVSHDAVFTNALAFLTSAPITTKPGARFDFILVHRKFLNATEKACLSFTLDHFDANNVVIAHTNTVPTCQTVDTTAQAFIVPDDYWILHTGQTYSSNSIITVKGTGAAMDVVFVRQCYCE